MGLRFRRSVRLFPGVRLNFSGSGISTSIGGRGGHVTYGHGHVRTTFGIPGTGLSWSSVSRHSPGQPRAGNIGCMTVIFVGLLVWIIVPSSLHQIRPENSPPSVSLTKSAPVLASVSPAARTEFISPMEAHEQYVVAVNVLNQRDRPDGNVVGILHRGALVDVFETTRGWARITSAQAPARWVSAKLLCRRDACAPTVSLHGD
jgi:hypothetical protein